MINRIHAGFLVMGCVLAVGSTNAGAECARLSPDESLKSAHVVFRGVVTEVQRLDKSRTVVTLDVSRAWKGPVGKRMVLHQATSHYLDYFWPANAVGTEFLVFATRLTEPRRKAFKLTTPEAFAVPMCGGGTAPIAEAGPYVDALGPGRAPQ